MSTALTLVILDDLTGTGLGILPRVLATKLSGLLRD